jgi:hypothetical protein
LNQEEVSEECEVEKILALGCGENVSGYEASTEAIGGEVVPHQMGGFGREHLGTC